MKQKKTRLKLPRSTQQVFSYWRQSIIDSRRMEISGREISSSGVRISFDPLVRGELPAGIAESLFKNAAESTQPPRSKTRPGAGFKNENAGSIPVVIAPLRFRRRPEQGFSDQRSGQLEPLWIPALLDRAGTLLSPPAPLPWIPRIFLEPAGKGGSLAIGDLDDVESFFEKRPPPRECSWKEYWKYCASFFLSVADAKIENFELEEYERLSECVIVPDNFAAGGTNNLERYYNDILSGRRPAGLAAKLSSLREPKRRMLAKGFLKSARLGARHFGQFEQKFALAPSQRLAVHEVLRLREGEILAVTGPPGTGKTTLIQSLIASQWIARARYSGLRPQVLVVCSATNQAVTNVIDSFAKSDSSTGPLAGRWLPGVSSHASFCASFTRASEGGGLEQVELTDGSGFSAAMENWDYVSRAEEQFLARFEQYGFKTSSTRRAVAYLHRQLLKEIGAIRSSIRSETWKEFWGLITRSEKPGVAAADLNRVLIGLDTTRRFNAFRIATHYWEGRWLLETAKLLSKKKLPAAEGRLGDARSDWERRAMITPCFVATFSTVTRFFGRERKVERAPIDLLIADEAGQVSIEIGAAPFSMAVKGVVIGDAEQLEPVCNINTATDAANMVRHGLIKDGDFKRQQDLIRTGVSAAGGSLMKRALRICPVQDHTTIGVFLCEHRRSNSKIVEFANAIAYRNRLVPMRAESEEKIMPPFSYAHVRGICSTAGKSRINRIEAEAIAEWLQQRRERLESGYQKKLDLIVAVLTPFVAQNRYLRSLLHRRFPKMTIGTVNSLQGAEREIVIFSPVYDQSERRQKIFDRSTNLLNVAVTRAKDSFIVFGDMGIFDPAEQAPSSVLARFLFESPENEIVDIEPTALVEMQESFERLSTLDQHREAVLRALRGAKRQVTIVSPTISVFAIRSDQIEREIRDARRRGIDVLVYTDENLDRDIATGILREPSELGRQLLVEAGAKVFVTKRIHNKAIAVDERELIEGSFNWLSAVRQRGSVNQKLEVSVRYSGPRAEEAIRILKGDLSERVLEEVYLHPKSHSAA